MELKIWNIQITQNYPWGNFDNWNVLNNDTNSKFDISNIDYFHIIREMFLIVPSLLLQ